MEQVVLLDDNLNICGSMDKHQVHTTQTPLHLAFSCYLVNPQHEVLLTRRALSKIAWPGVWTNSFCGHPMPDETLSDAVRRRAKFEVGIEVEQSMLLDNTFRYIATDAGGIKENEYCPVFAAYTDLQPMLNPAEAIEYKWVSVSHLLTVTQLIPEIFSPWMISQLNTPVIRHELQSL